MTEWQLEMLDKGRVPLGTALLRSAKVGDVLFVRMPAWVDIVDQSCAGRLRDELASTLGAKEVVFLPDHVELLRAVEAALVPAAEPPKAATVGTVDYTKLALAIVTWNRPANLAVCFRSWLSTLPAYRQAYVVNNFPDDPGLPWSSNKVMVINTGRPAEHAGNLAQSWNLAMLWAFRDPEVEWLLCSQDDMLAKPGWPEIVAKRDADLYLSPGGDQAFLFNRRALREVGWFDERFTTIGFQDWDWEARAVRALPAERLYIEDGHGWGINEMHLYDYWTRQVPDSGYKSQQWIDVNERWMLEKWGMNLRDAFLAETIPSPKVAEIDWYPWFVR